MIEVDGIHDHVAVSSREINFLRLSTHQYGQVGSLGNWSIVRRGCIASCLGSLFQGSSVSINSRESTRLRISSHAMLYTPESVDPSFVQRVLRNAHVRDLY